MSTPTIKAVISLTDRFSSVAGHFQKTLGGVESRIDKIKKGLMATSAVSAAAGLFGAMSLKAAGNFQEKLGDVKVLSGATDSQIATLSKNSLGFAKIGFGANEAASAVEELTRQGFKLNDAMLLQSHVLKLSRGAHIDVAKAVEASESVVDAYGITADKIPNVHNMLLKTAISTGNAFDKLTENISYLGPEANTLGINLTELSAVYRSLDENGVGAERATTGLKKIFADLTKPTSAAIHGFNRLGIRQSDLLDSNNKLKSLTNTVDVLSKHNATAADILGIFGNKAGPVMVALLRGGSSSLSKYKTELENVGDVVGELSDKRMKGFNGKLAMVGASFQNFQIKIANSGLLDWASRALDRVSSLVDRISDFASHHPGVTKMAIGFGAIALAVPPILLGVGAMAASLKSIIGITTLFSGLGKAKLMMGIFGGMTATVIGLGVAAAITGYQFYRMYKNWDDIKRGAKEIFGPGQYRADQDPQIKYINEKIRSKQELSFEEKTYLKEKLNFDYDSVKQKSAFDKTKAENHIKIDFANIPKGAKISVVKSETPIDMNLGYSMGTP